MAARVCPLCGASDADARLDGQYYADAPLDVMAVVECRACTMMFTNPIPTVAWNDTFLALNRQPDSRVWVDRRWQEQFELPKFRDGLAILQRVAPSGRLLDVGTGAGMFVDLARKRGYDAIGIDTLPAVADSETHGIIGGTTISDLPSATYDIATMWCVVAHEPDVLDLLRECCRVLRPGGLVLIETPNMTLWRFLCRPRAVLARLSLRQRSHDALGVYSHINHFTSRTLANALSACGFEQFLSHRVQGYGDTTIVDKFKHVVFMMSAGRFNFCHPLVMTARKA